MTVVIKELLRNPEAVDGKAPLFREAMHRFLTSDADDDDAEGGRISVRSCSLVNL